MRVPRDVVHNQSPEYRQALQELIRYEIQALVERLSATGEEALILTASTGDGTLTQFGSQKAEGFLQKHTSLGSDFLSYCNDDNTQSSADELGNFGDDIDNNCQKDDDKDEQEPSSGPFPSLRKRERTTSKRLSITETKTESNIYEVSQNSDMSASERNDSASSVSSFVEAKQKNDLECKICSREFRSYRSLNQHFRLHMAKSYKCGLCGKIFSLKKSYQRHLKTHGKDKSYDCGVCYKSFPDQYSLKCHRERHISVRNYSCNLCGKAFFEKYSLRVHQTSHFYSQRFEKNVDTSSGYSCHICQKILKTKTALKNHMLTHSAKKYTCEFCNKRFSLKYSYVRHRRIHTGEKPYKCGSCDRSFSDGSAWTKHVRTHSGSKPYSCDICSKSFFYKTACTTHMKNHQGKKSKQPGLGERNFVIVSSKEEEVKFDSPKISKEADVSGSQKIGFEISDSESRLFDEELNLQLDESDKDYDETNLLDSGFGPDIIPDGAEEVGEKDICFIPEKKEKPALIESVDLDESFQTDFVERNMPIKGLESVNEFISTAFPDDSDILADDTETDNATEIQQNLDRSKVKITSQTKPLKRSSRRSTVGKQIPELSIKCKKCHKVFHQESLLKHHLQFHSMMKLYKCRYCGKQLSTKHSLVRHERIHIGDRPYQCYLCQKKFADNYSCIRHIKQHFTSEEKTSPALSTDLGDATTTQTVSSPMSSHSESQSTLAGSHKQSMSHLTGKLFSDSRSSNQGYTSEDSFSKVKTFVQTKQAYNVDTNEQYMSSSPVTKQSENVSNLTSSINETPSTYSFPSTDISSVVSSVNTDRKQLFKCYACSSLFEAHQKCVEHIETGCCMKTKTCEDSNCDLLITKPDVETQLTSLFQCSLCSKMFDTESSCQVHIREQCLKSQVSTVCASQSVLNDTLQYTDFTQVESQETLPQLPFTELDTDQNYLNMRSDDVVFLPGQFKSDASSSSSVSINTNVSEPQKSPSYVPIGQLASQSSSSIQFCSKTPTGSPIPSGSIPFTGLVQKSVVNLGQSKFLVTNQGFSLVTSPAVSNTSAKSDRPAKKAEIDVNDRTCTLCNKVFTTKHILKQHTLIHMERKFECKYCMKKFHNKYGRDRHERIHTGEKPFSCPNCKKAFSDNSTYRKHTRVCCSGK